MENKLLSACCFDKEAFVTLRNLGFKESLSETGKIIYTEIEQYYERDPDASQVDIEILSNRIKTNYKEHKKLLLPVLSELREPVTIINLLDDFVLLRKEDLGNRIAAKLLSSPASDVSDYLREYLELEETLREQVSVNREFDSSKIVELFEEIDDSNKIRLWPKALNQALGGGVFRGTNILVFGRSNIGKSLFTINMVCGFLYDEHKVLVIGNEDPIREMIPRYLARMSGIPVFELQENPQEFIANYEDKLERFRFIHMEPGNFYEIEKEVKEFEPDVLVLDQIRNIHIGKKLENKVIQLEELAKAARNLAARQDIIVLSVTQAGDSARNKLVLDDGDIDFSNTGMPGAMDLIIGLGANEEYKQIDRLMVTIVKNKINGNHMYFPVRIDKTLSKVIS